MRVPELPSSPAADADASIRWWRLFVRSGLKKHLRRAGLVACAIFVIGAGTSYYLSEVGVSICRSTLAGESCREVRCYPFTVQRRSDITFVAGVPDGVRREWHPGGHLWLEGTYVQGVREGAWREYYADGSLRFEGKYAEDKLEGTETWFYANGHKEWQVGRHAGLRSGDEQWWHENGSLRREGRYSGGDKDGVFKVYDEHGRLAFTGEYRGGERIHGERVD